MAELSGEDQMMLGAYTTLARRIWEDEGYAKRAIDDSRATLAENGWTVPEGTVVSLEIVDPDDAPPADADVGEVVKGWVGGIKAGELRIVVPSSPSSPEAVALRRGVGQRLRRRARRLQALQHALQVPVVGGRVAATRRSRIRSGCRRLRAPSGRDR